MQNRRSSEKISRMFERLIQQLLSNLLSDYIEQSDSLQISFASLLQGKLDLENIPLRPLNLDIFGLPSVYLKEGRVGHFSLNIPPSSLFLSDRPWTLELADIFVSLEVSEENADNSKVEILEEADGLKLFELSSWIQIVKSISNKIQVVITNFNLEFYTDPSIWLHTQHLVINLNESDDDRASITIHRTQMYFIDDSNDINAAEIDPVTPIKHEVLNVNKMTFDIRWRYCNERMEVEAMSTLSSVEVFVDTQQLPKMLTLSHLVDFYQLFNLLRTQLLSLFGSIKLETTVETINVKFMGDPSLMELRLNMLDLNMRSDCSDLKASLRCFNLQLINLVDEEEIFHDALEETPVMWSHLLSRIEHTNTIFSIRMEENYQTRFILTFNERPFLLFSFWDFQCLLASSVFEMKVSSSVEYYGKGDWEPFVEKIENIRVNLHAAPYKINVSADDPIVFVLTQHSILKLIQFQQEVLHFNFGVLTNFLFQLFGVERLFLNFNYNMGFSLIDAKNEELVFGRFDDCLLVGCFKTFESLQLTLRVGQIQMDNQLVAAFHWQFIHCSANTIDNGVEFKVPAFQFELDFDLNAPSEGLKFHCLRLKLSDIFVNMEEFLLLKLIHLFNAVHPDLSELNKLDAKLYFSNLEVSFGKLLLSVETISRHYLPEDLQYIRGHLILPLVSFQNAQIELTTFRRLNYEFNGVNKVVTELLDFYYYQILKQLLNIATAMDVLGAPSTLTRELERGVEKLIFKGNVTGFLSSLSHGVTNSVSKLAASVSHGVGQLTSDTAEHTHARRRLVKHGNQLTTFDHLSSGIWSLSVGLYGGLTAVAKNTIESTQTNGFKMGLLSGLTTGAIDTVTKPTQGFFDLIESAALALKTAIGGEQEISCELSRLRLPQLYLSENEPLRRYDEEFVKRQHEFVRIIGPENGEVLVWCLTCYQAIVNNSRIEQKVFLTKRFCFVVRMELEEQTNEIVERIPFVEVRNCRATSMKNSERGFVEVTFDDDRLSLILCSNVQVSSDLCRLIKEQIK